MRPAQPAPITSPDELALEVRALGLAHGLDAIGVTSAEPLLRARAALEERKAAGLHAGMEFTYRRPVRSTTPSELVEGAATIVVGARRYESILPPRPDLRGPYGAVARYAWTDHYGPLKQALSVVAGHLRRSGYRSRVLADDNGLVDREVAHRAGLGWFGKNANLLRPGAGSWFVLGSVVTSAPLPVNEAPVADRCGMCRRCIDGCPTAAIVAPGVIDAGRCLAWLVQAPGTFPRAHREALGARIYGCDECQEVCPPNQRADAATARARWAAQQEQAQARAPQDEPAQDGRTQHEQAHAGPAWDHPGASHERAADRCPPNEPGRIEAWVSLLDILEADDETLLVRHGRWYLAGRDPRWLRRNALIALGNVADPADPEVAGALARYLGHRDPMLRAHTVWACRRLGREDLLDVLVGADEPEVAEELGAPAPAPAPARGATAARARSDVKHLLVTNDFPPKIGGIQSYLWELWRRLPPASFAVLTSPHSGAEQWDRQQPFLVRRVREPALLPHPIMVNRVQGMAAELGAELVVLDPALPLGLIGPSLDLPYDVVLHGAEVTVPGRLPGSRPLLAHVLRRARRVITAGGYPAAEGERAAERPLDVVVVPPGVDVDRFHPLDAEQRRVARTRFGVAPDVPLVVGVSRLVPRKGFDTVLRAAGRLRQAHPDLVVAIAGGGRDEARLRRLAAELEVTAVLLGRVPDDDLPSLYACADVFAMLCRNRWGGLEQEGFGIVFLEAAACGVPQVAGASGGAAEAVLDGETGRVIDPPEDVEAVAEAIGSLLADPERRARWGAAARRRVLEEFTYDGLSARLGEALGAE